MSALTKMIFAVILAFILVVVSLLLDSMMGIFIVCLMTCVVLNGVEDKNKQKKS